MNPGNLAEEIAGRVRARLHGMENDVSHLAHAEFQAIIALQFLALHFFAIYKGAVLAALVDNVKLTIVSENEGVITRHAWIGNHQILIHFSAHRERGVVEGDRALVISLHVNQ